VAICRRYQLSLFRGFWFTVVSLLVPYPLKEIPCLTTLEFDLQALDRGGSEMVSRRAEKSGVFGLTDALPSRRCFASGDPGRLPVKPVKLETDEQAISRQHGLSNLFELKAPAAQAGKPSRTS
jgi:hypothetical protein